jgi:hypothetical protein
MISIPVVVLIYAIKSIMCLMKWISAADIKTWITSNQRHCAQTLPELIRRLVLATATTVEEIEFPSGDSVAHSGWDGRLKTPVASPLFPSGASGWEIGTEASPGKKAEDDYLKRTKDSLGLKKADSSFVFVTPRAWPGRVKWQNEKRASSVWKDVRVIAADGLEQWLDLAPAVALWLGRQIKGLSDSLRDIEGFWEEWSASTEPKMTVDIVLAGRTNDVERIHQWLRGKAGILEVRGDSPDEPFAFLYGAMVSMSEQECMQSFSRCVLVTNEDQVRACANTFQNPLIIVAPAECRGIAGYAVDKGHHVFLSADARSIDFRDNLIQLSRPQKEVVEKNLRNNGLSEAEARKISRDFGRSIPALRRHLFRSSAKKPDWSSSTSAQTLIPLLFAGAWDERKDGDRNVIESLSGMTHDAYVKALHPFLSMDDSPIRHVGGVWMLKSPLDAWYLLAAHLTKEHLKLFEHAILSVLTKTDPKYDLQPEKRWMASVYGKSSPYSEWVHVGLVESLILIAVYGDRSPNISSTQVFSNDVVSKIFKHADKWEKWASVKDVTSLLAEASPTSFMDAINDALSTSPMIFEELMSDDGTVFGECRHSGLLWALEGVAWNPDYFFRATTILFDLSKVDKGGRWSNRPINSLKDIFVPALPQTNASPKQRLAALDALIDKDAMLVWKFSQEYYNGGTMGESHQFRWRDTGGHRRPLEHESNESFREYLKGLMPRLSELACRKENLIATTDEFTRLPEDIREKLLNALEKTDVNTFSDGEQKKLLQCLREALNWVNSYGDAERRKQVPSLWRIYNKYLPKDLIQRHGWLLSSPWPRRPEGESRDHDKHDADVKNAQEQAAREILDQVSTNLVIDFAASIQYQGVLGYSLGKAVKDADEGSKVLDALIEIPTKCPIAVRGFAQARVEKEGVGWIDRQIKRVKKQGNYTAEACALLYFGRDEGAETWSAVAAHGKEVEDAYWSQAGGYSRTNKEADAPIAVEKLLDANRPGIALQVAGDPNVSIPSPLIQRLLQDILTMDARTRNQVMDEYHIGNIFNQLYQRNDLSIDEMAKLEWPYAALFGEIKRYTSSPMALHRVLQKDPTFFAQLVSFTYKRGDRKPEPSQEGVDEEMLAKRAQVAHEVLNSWQMLPGTQEDGDVDEKILEKWVTEARKKCEEDDRITGGDIEIGFMLAHAPEDPDGVWPHAAVRNVIEKLNNDTIDQHIQTKIYNSRGVVSRGIGSGGQQERELASKYRLMSEQLKAEWPRTSALLSGICDTYENQAEHEDIESSLDDLRWD